MADAASDRSTDARNWNCKLQLELELELPLLLLLLLLGTPLNPSPQGLLSPPMTVLRASLYLTSTKPKPLLPYRRSHTRPDETIPRCVLLPVSRPTTLLSLSLSWSVYACCISHFAFG